MNLFFNIYFLKIGNFGASRLEIMVLSEDQIRKDADHPEPS